MLCHYFLNRKEFCLERLKIMIWNHFSFFKNLAFFCFVYIKLLMTKYWKHCNQMTSFDAKCLTETLKFRDVSFFILLSHVENKRYRNLYTCVYLLSIIFTKFIKFWLWLVFFHIIAIRLTFPSLNYSKFNNENLSDMSFFIKFSFAHHAWSMVEK